MTIISQEPAVGRVDARTLYPHIPHLRVCQQCFRADRPLNTTGAPEIAPYPGPLAEVCSPCFRALVHGRQVVLPVGSELADVWVRLVSLYQNGELAEDLMDAALAVLAPGLSPQDAAIAVGELRDALLWQQDVADNTISPHEVDPEVEDGAVLEERAAARVDAAVNALLDAAHPALGGG